MALTRVVLSHYVQCSHLSESFARFGDFADRQTDRKLEVTANVFCATGLVCKASNNTLHHMLEQSYFGQNLDAHFNYRKADIQKTGSLGLTANVSNGISWVCKCQMIRYIIQLHQYIMGRTYNSLLILREGRQTGDWQQY